MTHDNVQLTDMEAARFQDIVTNLRRIEVLPTPRDRAVTHPFSVDLWEFLDSRSRVELNRIGAESGSGNVYRGTEHTYNHELGGRPLAGSAVEDDRDA